MICSGFFYIKLLWTTTISPPNLLFLLITASNTLHDKGDYSIVEGFISALLGTIGYRNVKILALFESESNREDSFIHKSLFNTSRLIIDNLAQREDYAQILKVFHISLLYFPIGSSGAIYHGKTIIHEIETNDRLAVSIKNQEGETVDASDKN